MLKWVKPLAAQPVEFSPLVLGDRKRKLTPASCPPTCACSPRLSHSTHLARDFSSAPFTVHLHLQNGGSDNCPSFCRSSFTLSSVCSVSLHHQDAMQMRCFWTPSLPVLPGVSFPLKTQKWQCHCLGSLGSNGDYTFKSVVKWGDLFCASHAFNFVWMCAHPKKMQLKPPIPM